MRVQPKKTKNQKICLEQKSKITSSTKLEGLSRNVSRGAITVRAYTKAFISEKSIISAQISLKKDSKKAGIVWTKPIRIKTTTTKGEKRLGKGKGAVISYNRKACIKAGAYIFELGPLVDFSSKVMALPQQLRPVRSKLSFKTRISHIPRQTARLRRSGVVEYTPYK